MIDDAAVAVVVGNKSDYKNTRKLRAKKCFHVFFNFQSKKWTFFFSEGETNKNDYFHFDIESD